MQDDPAPAAYRRWLAGLLAAAAFLGTFRLGTPGVWLDEASSWYNASGSWSHLWQRALQGEDTGGILYSALLKAWIGLAGTSEAALRLPGVLLLLVLIVALARAATLLSGRWAGVCAGALALAHPSLLPAARQARGYILLLAWTAIALLAIAEWTQPRRGDAAASGWTGRQRRGPWLAAIASLGAAATHIFGVFVAVGTAWALASLAAQDSARERTRAALRVAAVALPAVVFAAAWTVLIGDRVRRNLESFWIPGSIASNSLAIGIWLVGPFAVAVAWLRWHDGATGTGRLVRGLVLFAVPIAIGPGLVSALSPGDGHFVMVRYAIALVAPAILATGLALAHLPRRAAVPMLAAVLAVSLGYSAGRNVYSAETRNGQDTREAAKFLRERVGAGDVLFVEPINNWMVLEYYGVQTVRAEGQEPGWRTVEDHGERHARTTWLVRFSKRSVLGQEVQSGVRESWRFGTITVSSRHEGLPRPEVQAPVRQR